MVVLDGWMSSIMGKKIMDIKRINFNIQGSNTYKQVLDFDIPWPYKSKSHIITNQKLKKPKNSDIEFHSGDIKNIVEKIKKTTKKDIWLIGGASLTQSFLKESLIDEMIIFTMPILLGSGISLFGTSGSPIKATLKSSEKYKSGVVQNHYFIKK
jgi:dihydrofolate reductase